MRAAPEGLDEGAVAAALRDAWDFDVDVLEYAPVGAGSYHWHATGASGSRAFVTVDRLDQKSWLGETRDESFDGLRAAFDTAVALRDSGLQFVVAPFTTSEGESLLRLDERYTIALFPHVDGTAGEFGVYESDEDERAVAALLADLHRARAAGTPVRTAGFELPGRQHLERALRELDEPWAGGPLSEQSRAAVADAASALVELLALFDRLAADARTRARAWVVTHGEPHAANVLREGRDRYLVDWDTVALGPPERDLWMLDGAAAGYEDATGTALDPVALDAFRLMWELKDLAEYLNVLRGPHEENADTLRQLGALTRAAAIRDDWPDR